MKLLIRLDLLIPFLVPSIADAEVASDEQLIRLARAAGILEQIEAQKDAIRAQGEQTAKRYAQKIVDAKPGLPAEFEQFIEKEMEIYLIKISNISPALGFSERPRRSSRPVGELIRCQPCRRAKRRVREVNLR